MFFEEKKRTDHGLVSEGERETNRMSPPSSKTPGGDVDQQAVTGKGCFACGCMRLSQGRWKEISSFEQEETESIRGRKRRSGREGGTEGRLIDRTTYLVDSEPRCGARVCGLFES